MVSLALQKDYGGVTRPGALCPPHLSVGQEAFPGTVCAEVQVLRKAGQAQAWPNAPKHMSESTTSPVKLLNGLWEKSAKL